MKVHELISLLEEQDENAEVFLLSQPHWPFEFSLAGVTTRGEVTRADNHDDEDGEDTEDSAGELRKDDVFLCEGSQLRYGSKNAWHVMTQG